MSDVLIKGMEMPKSCFECPFRRKVDPDNIMCIVAREVFEETFAGTIKTRNHGNCPLIPVPKHGRLVDADALTKDLGKRWNVNDDQDFCNKEVWRGIEDAPTVIEAEEGE